ncbi:S-layer homology domain-containing protein [Metasolibacillus sp.]|uniref:CAP and S-layer homology domain-containing protein n=1 Tax=Metasolibacillus sp. TaxID=2703680 RepID=UPI0025E7E40A|nr:S-layer homology domain-containing protein [Metasolibacillus sp.]MCT6923365.1 S-layer homology domain-containing protein [Metasolibacillus sp.]MCT6939912.1 S-layer homology domain-containing protein [Metasolibacillus sp.]
MKEKLIVVMLALACIWQTPAYAAVHFKDLPNAYWATPAIMQLVDAGYMEGFEDNTFRPNELVTREEAAVVIARAIGGAPAKDFLLQATDVPPTHTHYAEIRKLAQLGIIQNNELFQPDEPLQRAHLAKMIALAFHITTDAYNKAAFKDLPKNYWAKNYIESLADIEIVTGKTASKFEPTAYVTRAHLAAFIARGMAFQQKVARHEVVYDYLGKGYIQTISDKGDFAKEAIAMTNQQRQQHGLKPLTYDPQLTQLAVIKAQDMIQHNYFEHQSPRYGAPWDMAELFDYAYTSFGENIARNFNSAQAVTDAWMVSTKHRENILKASYTHIGIGIKCTKDGQYYWVQLFSSK